MTLRDELFAALERSGAPLPDDLEDHTSLIHSGILDSTALFELALWVEERVGHGLDLTSFDLANEWDTPARLVDFLERHGAADSPSSR